MGEFRGNQHEVPDEYVHEYSYEQLVEEIAGLAEELGRRTRSRGGTTEYAFR